VQVRVAQTPEEGANLLAARRAALSALSRLRPTTILEDATVPRSRLAEMVAEIERIAEKYDVQICTFGHAGDGNLHPTCLTDERNKEELARVEQAFEEIFLAALRLGGTISGEHGIGLAKRDYLPLQVGEGGIALMKAIKEAFDPNHIMNPGKMFANSARRRVVIKQ
jgi:glycolate oxidase